MPLRRSVRRSIRPGSGEGGKFNVGGTKLFDIEPMNGPVAQAPGSRVHDPQRVKMEMIEGMFESDQATCSEFQTWTTRPNPVARRTVDSKLLVISYLTN
jgi:hypothetical protein